MNLSEHRVLLIKIVIFSLIIGYFLYKYFKGKQSNMAFPPWPAKCPDHWLVTKAGCHNKRKLGKCGLKPNEIQNFDDPIFKGEDSLYFKCKWAKNCETPWEGIDTLCL